MYGNVVLLWIIAIGLIAFVLMGYDKLVSKIMTQRRVPEKNFWVVAALGGFICVGIGALVFYHKVSKMSFWLPIIATTAVWFVAFYFLLL
jgi:uncharacterized membrane protein YsdA (DUF1294 family)